MKHTHTETTEINFSNLEKRLLQINDEFTYIRFKDFIEKPTFIKKILNNLIV